MKQDYYETLEIDKKATAEEIKKAYRGLSKKHHPDMNPDNPESEEAFKRVSEAYECLSNPEKKSDYDRYGHYTPGQRTEHEGFGGFGDLGDFFRSFNRAQNRTPKGSTVRLIVSVSLEEIFNGCVKDVDYDITSSTEDDLLVEKVKINVNVPKGIYHGTRTLVPNRGCKIHNGNNGDLEIIILQAEHNDFIREGDELLHVVKIGYYDFILGCELIVPTIEGTKIKVNVPKFSQVDKVMRVKGKGMVNPENNKHRGDMHIMLKLDLPTEITDEEEKMLKKLKNIREGLSND